MTTGQSKQSAIDRIARRLGRPLTPAEHASFDGAWHGHDQLKTRASLLRRGFVSRIQRRSLDRPIWRILASTSPCVSLLADVYRDRVWPERPEAP